MMVVQCGQDRVEAVRGLEHRRDYRCPVCGSAVVLHAHVGGWVIPHFKHKASSACLNGKGESPAHRAIKTLLRDHYHSKDHNVELEFFVGARRADVFLADSKVAFEVEFSPKEVSEFVAKCRDYSQAQVRSAWIFRQKNISVSDVAIGNSLVVTVSRVLDFLQSDKRPRGASFAFFAYDKNEAVVFRGSLSSLMLYKEYDEYSGGGGYEYPSRRTMWLSVKEVIRVANPKPKFPSTQGKRGAGSEDACAAAVSQAAA